LIISSIYFGNAGAVAAGPLVSWTGTSLRTEAFTLAYWTGTCGRVWANVVVVLGVGTWLRAGVYVLAIGVGVAAVGMYEVCTTPLLWYFEAGGSDGGTRADVVVAAGGMATAGVGTVAALATGAAGMLKTCGVVVVTGAGVGTVAVLATGAAGMLKTCGVVVVTGAGVGTVAVLATGAAGMVKTCGVVVVTGAGVGLTTRGGVLTTAGAGVLATTGVVMVITAGAGVVFTTGRGAGWLLSWAVTTVFCGTAGAVATAG
jgi:hypothetical protein